MRCARRSFVNMDNVNEYPQWMQEGNCWGWDHKTVLRTVVRSDPEYDYLNCGHQVEALFEEANDPPPGSIRRICPSCGPEKIDNPWFPPRGKTANKYIVQAKAICATCPVRQECEDWALDRKIRGGVYGGYSFGERQGLADANQEQ